MGEGEREREGGREGGRGMEGEREREGGREGTTKEIKCCQPVMTNECPALDSRALAQDLTKVRLSLP